MGIIAQNKFTELFTAQQAIRQQCAQAMNQHAPAWLNRNDAASALQVYEQLRDHIERNGYIAGKLLRPWLIDPNYTGHLDREQMWWGIEFETGYKSAKARGTAVRYVWDNFNGTAFDSEGEGAAAVEITFGPEEMGKFQDGTAQAYRFMQFLDQNPDLVQNGGGEFIGTHMNISHKAFTAENISKFNGAMNRTIGNLPSSMDSEYGLIDVRRALFGRSQLYGGFFVQNQGGKQWLEGKLFRTVYTMNAFNRYIRTGVAMSKSLQAIVDAFASNDKLAVAQRAVGASPYVDNLLEMALDDTVQPKIMWTMSANGQGNRGDVNAGYHRDTHPEKHPQTYAEIEAEARRKEEERLEKERKLAEQKAREEAEKRLMGIHKAHAANNTRPAGIPDSYSFCEYCELFHDDDDNVWMGE